MKNEPGDIAGKSFDDLAHLPDGSPVVATVKPSQHTPSGANFEGGLGVPELREIMGTVLGPAAGEGEG